MGKILRLTQRIRKEIKSYASGSIYRLNVPTADCYTFTLYKNDKGKLDFEGGWDWTNDLVDKAPEWIYLFKEDKFIKNITK